MPGFFARRSSDSSRSALSINGPGANDTSEASLKSYADAFESSWARKELYGTRNFRTAFKRFSRPRAVFEMGVQMVLGGRGLFYDRLDHKEAVHEGLGPARQAPEPPPFDGKLTFDKLTDVYHSGTNHEEDQPPHLVVRDPDLCVSRCKEEYGNPCQYFCPAAVYEMVPNESYGADGKSLQVNFSNCVHCKTCDIMDPYQIIDWVTPEGGGGPNYGKL